MLHTVAVAADSDGAATSFYALPAGAVAEADVVPLFLVSAAHDLAGRFCSVLVANTAGHYVGAASWYRALLQLWPPAILVGAVAFADVVPFCLAGAARDLAGRCCSVLVANTTGHCVGAASWYRALLWLWPLAILVGAVAFADVVPDLLVGAAHDLAGRVYSISVLAANTACMRVSAASWYRTLLPLVVPTMLPAVPICF